MGLFSVFRGGARAAEEVAKDAKKAEKVAEEAGKASKGGWGSKLMDGIAGGGGAGAGGVFGSTAGSLATGALSVGAIYELYKLGHLAITAYLASNGLVSREAVAREAGIAPEHVLHGDSAAQNGVGEARGAGSPGLVGAVRDSASVSSPVVSGVTAHIPGQNRDVSIPLSGFDGSSNDKALAGAMGRYSEMRKKDGSLPELGPGSILALESNGRNNEKLFANYEVVGDVRGASEVRPMGGELANSRFSKSWDFNSPSYVQSRAAAIHSEQQRGDMRGAFVPGSSVIPGQTFNHVPALHFDQYVDPQTANGLQAAGRNLGFSLPESGRSYSPGSFHAGRVPTVAPGGVPPVADSFSFMSTQNGSHSLVAQRFGEDGAHGSLIVGDMGDGSASAGAFSEFKAGAANVRRIGMSSLPRGSVSFGQDGGFRADRGAIDSITAASAQVSSAGEMESAAVRKHDSVGVNSSVLPNGEATRVIEFGSVEKGPVGRVAVSNGKMAFSRANGDGTWSSKELNDPGVGVDGKTGKESFSPSAKAEMQAFIASPGNERGMVVSSAQDASGMNVGIQSLAPRSKSVGLER